jgi:hypothetical protein
MTDKRNWTRKLTPGPIRKFQRYLRDKKVTETFQPLSNAEAFDKIYADGLWGENMDKKSMFFSGEGSHINVVVDTYVSNVETFLENNQNIKTAADLGCGDFNVGRQICKKFDEYHAVDVSRLVVEQNKKAFKFKGLKFHNLSITTDSLPEADVAFVRQVLQHLSNDDIKRFLKNIDGKYRFLILTETLSASWRFIANKDIVTGPGVRFHKKSGVVLTKPPFNLEAYSETELCRATVGKEQIVTTVFDLQ